MNADYRIQAIWTEHDGCLFDAIGNPDMMRYAVTRARGIMFALMMLDITTTILVGPQEARDGR